MTFRTSLAIALVAALAVSASPDALTAQDQKAIPGDTFTPTHLRAFADQGIVTAGDLVAADPELVGRILEIDPQRARQLQQELNEAMRQ